MSALSLSMCHPVISPPNMCGVWQEDYTPLLRQWVEVIQASRIGIVLETNAIFPKSRSILLLLWLKALRSHLWWIGKFRSPIHIVHNLRQLWFCTNQNAHVYTFAVWYGEITDVTCGDRLCWSSAKRYCCSFLHFYEPIFVEGFKVCICCR